MDRKSIARCAAATASLSALLSVGCGNNGVEPASTASQHARKSTAPPAVVVSPEKDFFQRPAQSSALSPATASATEVVVQQQPPAVQVDPWAAEQKNAVPSDSQAASSPEPYVAEVAEVVSDPYAEPVVPSYNYEPAPAPLEPEPTRVATAQISSTSELKFASDEPAPVTERSAIDTFKINLGPQPAPSDKASAKEASTEKAPAESAPASRYAKQQSKKPLLPLVVTPRATASQTPTKVESPTLAAQQPSAAEQSSNVAEPETQPIQQPTVAKLSAAPVAVASVPEALQPEPVVAEPAAAEPVVQEEPQSTLVVKSTPPVEETPAPLAKSEPNKMSTPTLAREPQANETALAKTQPIATPPASAVAEVDTVRPAREFIPPKRAATGEPTPAVKAPLEAVAKLAPTPAAPPTVVAPAPIEPVAVQPAPVLAAPVTQTPVAPLAVAATPTAPLATPQPMAPVAVSPSVPLPQVPGTRSPAMVATLAQADERVRHAIQLAEKGAMYASRKEFTAAITLIAQAHDVERATRQHSQAVAAGFLALKESHDFVKPGAADIDMVRLVASHKTPVLQGLDVSDLPPTLAAQHYYGYAKEHLAAGVGRETVGSIALYGLGKIIISGAGQKSQQLEFTGPAMTLYQAALICEPQNFRAAHELGVLLAGSGQLELARQMLMGSVAQSPQPMMYRNLAVVHSRLGEPQLAAQAQQQADTLQQTNPESKAPPVQWVDPATFASLGANGNTMPSTPAGTHTSPKSTESEKPAGPVAQKRPKTWNPLNLRR